MSDRSSLPFRSHSASARMSAGAAIAREAQEIVQAAARPVVPGATVKAQLRQATRALGYPDGSWRVREAWYGGAGSWSARAVRDLQDRYVAWREREDQRRAAAETTEQAARARREQQELEALRDEHRAALAAVERQLAACEAALALPHPDLVGAAADAARLGAAAPRGAHRPVGGRAAPVRR